MKNKKNDNIFVRFFSSKILISVLSAILVFLIVLTSIFIAKNAEYGKLLEEKIELTEILEEAINNDIIEIYYEDYDNDGEGEAFAIVGDSKNVSGVRFKNAELWFVNENGVKRVESNIIEGEKTDTLEYVDPFDQECKYLCLELKLNTSDNDFASYVYGVSDGIFDKWQYSGDYMHVHQSGKKIKGTKIGSESSEEISFENFSFHLGRDDDISTDAEEDEQDYSTVTLGSYPQTEVTDENIKAELNKLCPLASGNWVAYDFGNNNNTDGSMKYCDVDYNGTKYRGVYFTKYRSTDCENRPWAEDGTYSLQDENGYVTETTYWFRFEDIEWMVFDAENSIVTSKKVLDAYYFSECEHKQMLSYTNSSINSWLNENFLDTAFNITEKGKITKSTLELLNEGNLETSVFLFSKDDRGDLLSLSNDFLRVKATDYAKCMGVQVENDFASWYTRTPGAEIDTAHYVGTDGTFVDTPQNATVSMGIRPVIKMS